MQCLVEACVCVCLCVCVSVCPSVCAAFGLGFRVYGSGSGFSVWGLPVPLDVKFSRKQSPSTDRKPMQEIEFGLLSALSLATTSAPRGT